MTGPALFRLPVDDTGARGMGRSLRRPRHGGGAMLDRLTHDSYVLNLKGEVSLGLADGWLLISR